MSQNRKGLFSKIEKVSSFTSVCFVFFVYLVSLWWEFEGRTFCFYLHFSSLNTQKKGAEKKGSARTLREGRVTRDKSKQGALAADWLMEHMSYKWASIMVVITSSSTSFDLISRRRQTSGATISRLVCFYIHTCNLVTMLECQQPQFILQKYVVVVVFFNHIDNIFFFVSWPSTWGPQLVRCTIVWIASKCTYWT